MSSFVLQFQERCEPVSQSLKAPSLLMATQTITEVRQEEPDLDPRAWLGTQTETRTQEEPDQDVTSQSFNVFPR